MCGQIYVRKRCIHCYIKQCVLCKKKQEVSLFKKGSKKCNSCLYKIRKEYLKDYNLKYNLKRKEKRQQLIKLNKEIKEENIKKELDEHPFLKNNGKLILVI